MVSFIELGRLGRLGNQMFQYAALRGLGLRHNYETKIPDPASRTWHGQSCLLNNFNISRQYLTATDLKMIKGRYVEPDYMTFDTNFYNLSDNIDLYGFFQSTYYFRDFESQIKRELTPLPHFLEEAQQVLDDIRDDHKGHEIVSLHLRRGDNTDGSNPSSALNTMYGEDGNLQVDSFYGRYLAKAKKEFARRKVKFLVFSGGSRANGNSNEDDLEWCRRNFQGDEYIFANKNDTMLDFSLIMSCDHNIISHISSFGWWAAYLNCNLTKVVVAPEKYHPDREDINFRPGFYPPSWRLA